MFLDINIHIATQKHPFINPNGAFAVDVEQIGRLVEDKA
jgi:hypothetical protein